MEMHDVSSKRKIDVQALLSKPFALILRLYVLCVFTTFYAELLL